MMRLRNLFLFLSCVSCPVWAGNKNDDDFEPIKTTGLFNDDLNDFEPISIDTPVVDSDPVPRFCSLMAALLDETPGQNSKATWSASLTSNFPSPNPGGTSVTTALIGVEAFLCSSSGVSFVWENSNVMEHIKEQFVFGVVQDDMGNHILKLARSPIQKKSNPYSWRKWFSKVPLKTIDFTETGFTEMGEKPRAYENRTLCRTAQGLRANPKAKVKKCTASEMVSEWSSLQENDQTPSFSIVSSQNITFSYTDDREEVVNLIWTLKAIKVQGSGVTRSTP